MKNRIPWWSEVINKKKGHDVEMESTNEEYHDYEMTDENVEKAHMETDENDVYYDSFIDPEDLDNNQDGKETTTDIATGNKVDEDEFHGFEKEMGESMEALNNGKGFFCYDPVTRIKDISNSSDTIGIDNNASNSGIDEDEEYHVTTPWRI